MRREIKRITTGKGSYPIRTNQKEAFHHASILIFHDRNTKDRFVDDDHLLRNRQRHRDRNERYRDQWNGAYGRRILGVKDPQQRHIRAEEAEPAQEIVSIHRVLVRH